MPQNKDQLLRYKVLNACFRDTSRLYDINALVECCHKEMMRVYEKSVSKRTVQNDLQLLQLEPYNVEFDEQLRKSHYYRYADTSFNLAVVADLTNREKTALRQTVELLRPLCTDADNANPLMQWMFMVLQRLESGKPIAENTPSVSFENNGALAGMGNFNVLLESIINHQPITIRYRSFRKSAAKDINVHPYHLKQYNGRWYLVALPEGYSNIATYALDRIFSVKLWNKSFQSTDIDFESYFSDTLGVTVDPKAKTEHVVLRIAAWRYPYVETKPFSEKQKVIHHDDDTVTISFPMRINPELVSEILSFGHHIEVLEPLSLREEVSTQIADLAKRYLGAQKPCTPE